MGKSEILMLLAGVALSIMLAMIAIPMFSSGNDMADRQQVQQDLMAIKSVIPIIDGIEGKGNVTPTNIERHMSNFKIDGAGFSNLGSKKALYTIDPADLATAANIIVKVNSNAYPSVDLTKLSRLEKICDGGINTVSTFTANTDKDDLICFIKR